ncbi:hypothetical protein HOLleu_33405 [Holothuria leucospilota]|uniref:Uncharacterized protein n=1 Tax=Holothuria leucospilota TaxID=206669 RepID=A0A9Q1BFE7_HOLLE|nr:hypothetical protein HOLleu_33405 [Holothuria leucospilota]
MGHRGIIWNRTYIIETSMHFCILVNFCTPEGFSYVGCDVGIVRVLISCSVDWETNDRLGYCKLAGLTQVAKARSVPMGQCLTLPVCTNVWRNRCHSV